MKIIKYCGAILIFIIIVLLRTIYGICVNFNEDQAILFNQDYSQIYAIGLKSYLNNSWPYFGPDIVYTNTQLPGALQGLFIIIPLKIYPSPYSPFIFLNLITTAVLFLFAWYTAKHFQSIPKWFFYAWILIAPWPLNYGTTIINPSYLIIPCILFFISFMETLPIYSKKILHSRVCFFIMGFSIGFALQLNLSWVLLPFFTLLPLYITYKAKGIRELAIATSMLLAGFILISLTLFPTLIKYGLNAGGAGSVLSFNSKNLLNFDIVTRFFSLASFEVLQFVSAKAGGLMAFLENYIWAAPFTIITVIIGYATVAFLLFFLIKKTNDNRFRYFRWVTICSMLLVYLSYLFTIRSISTFTLLILFPIAFWFSFYCVEYLFQKKYMKAISIFFLLSGVIYQIALAHALSKGTHIKQKIEKIDLAIQQKDSRLFSIRRVPVWEEEVRTKCWIKKETTKGITYFNYYDLYPEEAMPDQLTSKTFKSPPYSVMVDTLSNYSPSLDIEWMSVSHFRKVKIFFKIKYETSNDAGVAISVDQKENNLFWKSIPICEMNPISNEWLDFSCSFDLPKLTSNNTRLKCYVFYPNQSKKLSSSIFIDNFSIDFSN